MPFTFGVVLGGFVAVLYLAAIFLIIHRSVEMRVSTILESKDLEGTRVTQRVEKGEEKGMDQIFNPISEAGAAEIFKEGETRQEGERESPWLPVESLENILRSMDSRSSRSDALRAVVELWTGAPEVGGLLSPMEDDPAFFNMAAGQNGLQILRITDNPDLLRKLNLPAVLEFRLPGSPSPRYLALLKMVPEGLVFSAPEGGDGSLVLSRIPPSWSGAAYIPWKNFLGYDRMISYGSAGDPVLSLKTFLRDLGYEGVEITPAYDEKTVTVIKGIQAKHGLATDGVIGPLTRIALYNEHGALNVPYLAE